MQTGSLLQYGCSHPITTLTGVFLAWKSILLLVVVTSPGLGYDTSTSLLSAGLKQNVTGLASDTPNNIPTLWLNFVRWDAIYFTQMAQHGHVFEQEWAFGIGISSAIGWTSRILERFMDIDYSTSSMVAGVCLSHIAHWLAVVQVWAIGSHLSGEGSKPSQQQSQWPIPFLAGLMHILSPAGVFLSTPNTESLFACLSFSGFLTFLWATAYFNQAKVLRGCVSMVAAGVAFGLATIVRSNGILAGIPFLIEAATIGLAALFQVPSLPRLLRLASVVVGGLLVATGMVIPQFLAYQEYCAGRSPGQQRREWCEWTVPSIFTFVQSHYWNVGPFRYWTLSNLPLFLLAAPTLWILTQSAIEALQKPETIRGGYPLLASTNGRQQRLVASLALPQLLLAVLAFTSYHVQIITRISSGYPLWYVWLAAKTRGENAKHASVIIRWMMVYALVQAGLYASFLPPA